MDSIPISPIDPARYYDARYVATMRGLNVATVYQSVKGLKKAPIPRVTRFNSEVKFLGRNSPISTVIAPRATTLQHLT